MKCQTSYSALVSMSKQNKKNSDINIYPIALKKNPDKNFNILGTAKLTRMTILNKKLFVR